MKIVDNPRFNETLGPVRNEVLQKLMYLMYVAMTSRSLGDKALGRDLGDAPITRKNLLLLVERLKPEHVVPLLGVSKRTAYEYVHALRYIVAMCFL